MNKIRSSYHVYDKISLHIRVVKNISPARLLAGRRRLLGGLVLLDGWRRLALVLLQDERHLRAPEGQVQRVVHARVQRQRVGQR